MKPSPLSCLALLLLCPALTAQANKLGGSWEREGLFDSFGSNPPVYSSFGPVVSVGDLNNDQFPEYVLMGTASGRGDSGLYMVSGKDGSCIWSIGYTQTIGSSYEIDWCQLIHDFDGDGQRDLLVGVPEYRPSGWADKGLALIHSGANGQILWSAGADLYGTLFADSGSPVADVNFDGIPDFVIGANGPIPGNSSVSANLRFFSGADGSLLHTVLEFGGGNIAFTRLASLGQDWDVNGDGIGDLLSEPMSNEVKAISGLDGATLYTCWICSLTGFGSQPNFTLMSDVDGDGVQDFALRIGEIVPDVGGVCCRSGSDGTEIWRTLGKFEGTGFGNEICAIPDFTGDGISDLLVSEPWKTVNGQTMGGLLHLLDGATGETYRKIKPSEWSLPKHEGFGYSMDYDLATETLVIRESVEISWVNHATMTYKFHPYLTSPVESISSSQGSTFSLDLEFPVAAAGKLFALLLSRHGYGPSNFSGVKVPLAWDGLFSRSITGSLPPFFQNSQGALDINGDGSILVNLPANALSQIIGQSLTASVIAFVPGTAIDFVSVAVEIEVTP